MSGLNKNHYELLEIPINATQDDIHESYLRLKSVYSRNNLALYSLLDPQDSEQALESIEEAYGILSNPSKRLAYDKARGFNQQEGERASPHSLDLHDKYASIPITRIMAKERFSLTYKTDPEFEKKIEQTTEWTGEWLRKIREYKCVDIPRMADMTKVSKTHLHSIEEEHFDKLPPMAYVRGFVYQYAKCLKLNPEIICASYLSRMKKTKEAPSLA